MRLVLLLGRGTSQHRAIVIYDRTCLSSWTRIMIFSENDISNATSLWKRTNIVVLGWMFRLRNGMLHALPNHEFGLRESQSRSQTRNTNKHNRHKSIHNNMYIYIYITLYLRRLFSDQRAFHVDPHETPLPKMVELLSLISTGEGSLWPSSIGISFFTVSPKICCFWASTTSATKETTEPQ